MWARLLAVLRGASGATLTLTGVLGLAVIYALLQIRGQGPKRDESDQMPQQPFDPSLPSTSAAGGARPTPAAAATPAAAVARRLAGVRRVTLSVPGVLLEESSPDELEESANVCAGAAELVCELARRADLYLMCHVADDIGEAVVRGALEHAGVTGSQRGQVKPHRVLFCGTLEGKVPLVRQLEPELHIDGSEKTVLDLQRFVQQLVLVQHPPAAAAAAAAGSSAAAAAAPPNVQHAPSLAAALGLP
ncbi:Peroxisome biogenesis 22 [Micractinium conductrix]|uniref:Peroxisome biogenesis 22 n=1 Tax=Micractinium conductrix TaxID=554055 RepID=A0A2P6VJ86_9CHLO|nr:Peroxisome biogenesis 22 [Micractinium conductrix]|eukprot:PSC74149.1 Peroxisome biogenesis 22 [Micractinium conductrix]